MSYILDALKKSETEREQTGSLLLQNSRLIPRTSSASAGKRPRYGPLGAAVFLASAVCLIWYQRTGAPVLKTTSQDIGNQQVSHTTEKNSSSAKQGTGLAPRPQAAQKSPPPPKSWLDRRAEHRTFQDTAIYEPLPITPEGVVIPLSRFTPPPAPDPAIGSFKDLPVRVKSMLPDLSFAGHTWASDPQQRLIMVNNRIVREGDYLENNLILREITWHGVVLETSGETFQIRTH